MQMPYESDPLTDKLNELVISQQLYTELGAPFKRLNGAEQALIGTWQLANEGYNGGFVQYFRNAGGERAKFMVGILRTIGAERAASILESAIALAGPGTPWGDEKNYLAAIKSMPAETRDRLSECERNFYEELDDVHRQLFIYLSKHRGEIDAPTDFWTEPPIQ